MRPVHRIAMSDEILVLTIGGYIGGSTEREIEFAKSCGVRVRFLESIDGDGCSQL